MQYRAFGRSGIEVSEMVFGGGYVGGILLHQDDDTRRAAVRRALDGGVNWFDTAPSYGQGKSEEALGWLLEEIEDNPHVSTKVALDLTRLDDVSGQIERSLQESLSRLRRDSVDLLQLHNPIGSETRGGLLGVRQVLGKGGVTETFERLRKDGLIRLSGITALGEAQACRQVLQSGRFDSAQVYYNMLNASAAEDAPASWSGHDLTGIMTACRQQGMAVMVIRVLAAGVLATEQRTGREIVITQGSDVETEEQRARRAFETLGPEHGTRAQTAIRFALANNDVSCVVVGLAELAHIEEALAGFDMGPLADEAMARLRELQQTDFV